MAIVRKSAEEARRAARLDREKVASTTDDDIRRYIVEDGDNPDSEPPAYQLVVPAGVVRAKLGMTQARFAIALGVPLATIRNWEQSRSVPEPAARTLLALVYLRPAALKALVATRKTPKPAA